jgi:hypothetical protein
MVRRELGTYVHQSYRGGGLTCISPLVPMKDCSRAVAAEALRAPGNTPLFVMAE